MIDPDNIYPEDFNLILFAGEHYTVDGDTIRTEDDFLGTLDIHLKVYDGTDSSEMAIVQVDIIKDLTSTEKDLEEKFTIMPNPVKDFIFIHGIDQLEGKILVKIITADGREALIKKTKDIRNNSTLVIDTQNLQPGFYILSLIFKDFHMQKRFLKQ